MPQIEQLQAALEGRYTIERLVGEGGMATVYLARDLRHRRNVALKVLRPDLGAVLGLERFTSEIEVTANLQHPNLLPLFDSGAAGDLLFYVMPFVEGESLRARLDREKQLPIDDAIRLATAVASALDSGAGIPDAGARQRRELRPGAGRRRAGEPEGAADRGPGGRHRPAAGALHPSGRSNPESGRGGSSGHGGGRRPQSAQCRQRCGRRDRALAPERLRPLAAQDPWSSFSNRGFPLSGAKLGSIRRYPGVRT